MADNFAVLGNPEAREKMVYHLVTGKLDFAADHFPPGDKLYVALILSRKAHAIVTSMDTSAAKSLPGVKLVLTCLDENRYPLWTDGVFYVGQEIGAVVATSPDVAAYGVNLVKVEYDERPAVVDPDEAMRPGAPLVGPWPEGNVQQLVDIHRGDLEAGFEVASTTIERDIGWTQCHQHGEIEPCASVAWWVDDHVYIWTGTQAPHMTRTTVAGVLQMPETHVHIYSHGTGVGHGDKLGDWVPLVAYLARLTGQSVQLTETREDMFLSRTHQFPAKAHYKVGVREDGTLVAIDAQYWADGGANAGEAAGFTMALPWTIQCTYKCPNARFRMSHVLTNTPRRGAFRCVADPPSTFLMETFMDMVAEEIGMSPLEFRRKNEVTPDMPDQDSGKPWSSMGVRECLEKAAEAIGFEAKWHAPGARTLEDGRLHGIGISAHGDSHGSMMGMSGAIVHLTGDGKALINCGISDVGNGTKTAMCHIVAERMGMKLEDVMVGDWGNTDVCSDGGMQAGSTRTITLGAAFYSAAEDARSQAFQRAAQQLGVSADQLDARDSVIFVKNNPEQAVPYSAVSTLMWPLIGRGYTWPQVLQRPVGNFPAGTPCETHGTSASACEVAVDIETGEVEILNYVNVDDMGRVVWWTGAENQMLAGIDIQITEALFFGQIFEKTNQDVIGATINASYLEHKWPTPLDLPTEKYQVFPVETDDACGPFGAKGMGEPVVSNQACIANAIHNATGVWVTTPPITPMRVLKALGKA